MGKGLREESSRYCGAGGAADLSGRDTIYFEKGMGRGISWRWGEIYFRKTLERGINVAPATVGKVKARSLKIDGVESLIHNSFENCSINLMKRHMCSLN